MHYFVTEMFTFQLHIGVLWDICQMHYGICEMALSTNSLQRYFTGNREIIWLSHCHGGNHDVYGLRDCMNLLWLYDITTTKLSKTKLYAYLKGSTTYHQASTICADGYFICWCQGVTAIILNQKKKLSTLIKLRISCNTDLRVRPHWWLVHIGSGKSLVPSGNKPLPEPMVTTWHF